MHEATPFFRIYKAISLYYESEAAFFWAGRPFLIEQHMYVCFIKLAALVEKLKIDGKYFVK